MLVLTLKCEQAEQIRLRAGYGEATRVERLAEWLHRAICGWCRTAARQMEKFDSVLDAYRQRDGLPPILPDAESKKNL